MFKFQKQRGSVILGFIAGLVAGLLIAVVIALIVTKTSIPFSQKYVRHGKISESSISASVIDPNKPLYASGTTGKDAAKSSAKASAAQTAVKPEIPAQAAPEPAKIKTVEEDDPVAAAIRKQSTAKPAAQTHKIDANGDDRWTYMLQTNAYRDPAEAENERGRLALAGFDAEVMPTQVNGAKLYRVRLGPFKSTEDMSQTRARLTENGITAAVVRIPKK